MKFSKNSSTLPDGAFFHAEYGPYLQKNGSDLHENSIVDVPLDKKVPVKFWKLSVSVSGVRIPIETPDTDKIRLSGGLCSPSALLSNFLGLITGSNGEMFRVGREVQGKCSDPHYTVLCF